MNPISQERADWLKARIRVLGAMYTELMQRPAKYVNGAAHELHRVTLSSIQSEKLQLTIELDVLTQYLNHVAPD